MTAPSPGDRDAADPASAPSTPGPGEPAPRTSAAERPPSAGAAAPADPRPEDGRQAGIGPEIETATDTGARRDASPEARTGRLRRELGLFLYALQFLTRLPAPAWVGHSEDRLARALRWFPLVGALVGALGGGLYALAALALPPLAAAGLALAFTLALTGALHEDGLADTLDGLGGGATRERALEIMRDSRIGAYGAAGLVVSLLIRAGALAGLAPLAGLAALVAAHAAGRAAIAMAIRFARYARPAGAASGLAGGPPAGAWPLALALAAGICTLAAGLSGLAALALGLAFGGLVLARLRRRLGGYTGDGLGAVEQAAEIAALLTLAVLLR